jgi:hypothetical protein
MYYHSEIEDRIKSKVLSGVLPSIVFRELLVDHPGIEKHRLGSHFRVAFPNVDSVVWNIVAHWKMTINNDDFDMKMNISLIHELIKANYTVNWDMEWLEKQWERIKPIVSTSQ